MQVSSASETRRVTDQLGSGSEAASPMLVSVLQQASEGKAEAPFPAKDRTLTQI